MKRNIAIGIMLLMLSSAAFGGDFSKVGTSAAQFLKIGVGARAAGLGDAYGALANDVDALYWNPAGIASVQTISFAATHTQWFADISHNFAGLVVPLNGNGVVGLSVTTLGAPDQEVTTLTSPDGNGVYYSVSDIALGVSYARLLTDRFSVGITAKYIQQTAFNETASTFAFDLGTHLRTGFHNLVIGMAISNYGGNLQLEGRDLLTTTDIGKTVSGAYNPSVQLTTDEYALPLNFRVGIAVDAVGSNDAFIHSSQHRFTIAIDGNHPNDNVERLNIGGEYSWSELFFARIGYKINYDTEKWTYGTGVKIDLGSNQVAVDYALVDFGDLGTTSRISIGLTF